MKVADRMDLKNWYVLYTKPRHEKKVAERLSAAGYKVYCPLHKVKRQWSDRAKVVEEPLFKGHVFIRIEGYKRDEVFSYPGTVRYLFWLRRPAVVREQEIAIIKKWLGHNGYNRIQVSASTPGTYVRIISGKFLNEEGVLLDISGSKALIQLKEMGMQLSIDLSQNELQALQSHS